MEASEKVVKVNWYFHCWGFVGKLIGWRFWLAAFNWGFAGGFDFFYLPIDFETKKNKVPMLETHGDSDERGGVGSGFWQLSVSSVVKNDCWSPIRYTVPEVYFIPGKNPAFPSSIRFYPISDVAGGSFCSVLWCYRTFCLTFILDPFSSFSLSQRVTTPAGPSNPPGVGVLPFSGLFARATSSSIFAHQTWLESLRRLSPGTISAGDLGSPKKSGEARKLQEISGYETYHIHT